MTDNITVTPGSGKTVLADEVAEATLGTGIVQFVKLMDGTLDSSNKASVSAGGALKVDGSSATQPVSGTVTVQQSTASSLKVDLSGTGANTTALKVDGSAVTQPVSGTVSASQSGTWNVTNISGTISLPTGAATVAKQPALGTAGSASSDVISVQGIASMTALKVDGSGVTQPVSGTVAATQSGAWNARIQDGGGTALTAATRGSERALSVQIVDGSGTQITSFGGAGGTSSNFGSAFPTPGTAIGFPDGTNMQGARVFDADSGAGTQYVLGALLKKSASGGSVDFGTTSDPIIVSGSGSAGSAASGVISIQGIGSMTPVQVSQATAASLNATVVGTGTFAVQAAQSGTWSARIQDGAGNLLTSAVRGSERPLSVQIVDGSGAQVTTFGGSGGTSSNFGSAMPSAGTAIGLYDGTNMVRAKGDETSGLWVNIKAGAGSGGTAGADEAAFTAGTTQFTPVGGFFQTTATNNALTTGQMGHWQMTAQRAGFVNLRNASGTEIGTSGAPVRTDPTGTTTQPVSLTSTTVTGTVAVTQSGAWSLSANQSVNNAQINGVTPLMGNGVTGTGSQRVTIASDNTAFSVNAACAGDVASGSTDSGNPQKIGGLAKTANPTAVTDGQRVAALFDKLGKQVVVGGLRDLKVEAVLTLTASTTETTLLAAVASTFLDLYGLIISNTSATATEVTIRDATGGGKARSFYVPAGDTRGMMLPVDSAIPQATVNNNWTAQCGTSVSSIKITALFIKNT